jgi:hypothetical protein
MPKRSSGILVYTSFHNFLSEVRSAERTFMPLPNHTSPGRTLLLGTHKPPWSTEHPWFCLQNFSKTGGDSGRQVGLVRTAR